MFKGIGRAIVFVVDGIAKCCAVLLVSFGLWVPCLYSIAFFIILGISGAPFNTVVQTLYFVFLGITLMAGLVFALYLARRKKAKQQVIPVKNRVKKEERQYSKPVKTVEIPAIDEPEDFNDPPQTQIRPTTQSAPQTKTAYEKKYFQEAEPRPILPSEKGENLARTSEFEPSEYKATEKTQAKEENVESKSADILWKRLNNASLPNEKPMIFATRADPNLYVYEYSDRLQFWRKTAKGLTLVATEYKDKSKR